MALANLIGNYTAGQNAIASDVLTDLTSLLTRVNAITSEQINASQVLESHINALAVTTGKIGDGALSADATGRAKMADGYLTRAKMAADAKVSYVQLVDEQVSGTKGGATVAATWTILPLNTIYDNPDSLAVSVSSNKVTLPAGSYYMKYQCIFFTGARHRTRLWNVTDAGIQLNTGGNAMLSLTGFSSSQANVISVISGAFTLAASKELQFEYYMQNDIANEGLGRESSEGLEIYRTAEFWKFSD